MAFPLGKVLGIQLLNNCKVSDSHWHEGPEAGWDISFSLTEFSWPGYDW